MGPAKSAPINTSDMGTKIGDVTLMNLYQKDTTTTVT